MEKQIFYHDTDAGGVVYYGNYLKYLEEARTEYLTNKGVSLELFRTQEFLYAVKKCTLDYKAPARYGDTIVCDAKLIKVTAAKMIFEQKVYHKDTEQVFVEAEVVLVSLNKDFKPTPIPEDIKSLLS